MTRAPRAATSGALQQLDEIALHHEVYRRAAGRHILGESCELQRVAETLLGPEQYALAGEGLAVPRSIGRHEVAAAQIGTALPAGFEITPAVLKVAQLQLRQREIPADPCRCRRQRGGAQQGGECELCKSEVLQHGS